MFVGSVLGQDDAIERAKRLERRSTARAEREQLLRSEAG